MKPMQLLPATPVHVTINFSGPALEASRFVGYERYMTGGRIKYEKIIPHASIDAEIKKIVEDINAGFILVPVVKEPRFIGGKWKQVFNAVGNQR
jgi:hypothetical protein